MTTVKRTNSDYDITAIDSNISLTAITVTINGNLVVIGESSNVGSINTFIVDNFVTLAAGQTGIPTLNAGIEVNRGDSLPVGLRWYEQETEWQYTNDGIEWKPFSEFRLIDDPDPHLGGNLIVNDFWISSDPGKDVVIIPGENGNLIIGPVIRLPQIEYDPEPRANYSTIYAKTVGSGDTGFYVSNEVKVGEELITRRKAFLYSLIF